MTTICHILGLGAVGGLFASRLQRVGWSCLAITREPRNTPLHVRLTELDASIHQYEFPCDDSSSPINHLLITTKAHQTKPALSQIAHRLTPATNVLILQNGMQGFRDSQQILPQHLLLAGTTTEGVNRPAAGQWVHAGSGNTWIGPLRNPLSPAEQVAVRDNAEPWLNALQRSGLACQYDPAIRQRLWHKLLINSAINPLTVLFDCPNGELLTRPEAHTMLKMLCAEASAVMAVQPKLKVPANPLAEVEMVARNTALNLSSMLQDSRRGQETEIDAINGYLVELGALAGLECATHRQVIRQVKQLTCNNAYE